MAQWKEEGYDSEEQFNRHNEHTIARENELKDVIHPVLSQQLKPLGLRGVGRYGLETGHEVNIYPPVLHDFANKSQNDDQWVGYVSHQNSSYSDNSSSTGIPKAHAAFLGDKAEDVPSRLKEFITGREGMNIMRRQMNGTYERE